MEKDPILGKNQYEHHRKGCNAKIPRKLLDVKF